MEKGDNFKSKFFASIKNYLIFSYQNSSPGFIVTYNKCITFQYKWSWLVGFIKPGNRASSYMMSYYRFIEVNGICSKISFWVVVYPIQ